MTQVIKAFVVYNNLDNSIVGFYRYGYAQDVGQVCPKPDKQTALEIPPNHPVFEHQDQYKIQDGQLVQKNIVRLTANSPTFPADGSTPVQITFENLSGPTSIEIGGHQITLTPDDNVLTLTADAPQTFTLQVNDADQWSESLNVEAV